MFLFLDNYNFRANHNGMNGEENLEAIGKILEKMIVKDKAHRLTLS